jgi:tyrosyl-tRNA synthetase
MGVSDELMWRYWELLTDLSLAEIAALKRREPMEVKMDLASRIVADFHSPGAARQAAEDFNREVRQGAEPEDIRVVEAKSGRLASLLVTVWIAPSRTEAERLIKSGAVELDGERCINPALVISAGTHTIRAGKKWVRVSVS